MGRKTQVKCKGDEARFEEVARFVYERFGNSVHYIADVAGGQGMLSRILNKKYNYQAEVIDPRHYQVVGVQNRQCEYVSDMASYYDLVIGLHPDEAVREVVESAKSGRCWWCPAATFGTAPASWAQRRWWRTSASGWRKTASATKPSPFPLKGRKILGYSPTARPVCAIIL